MFAQRLPPSLFLAHAHAESASIDLLRNALPSRTELDVFYDPDWDFNESVSPAIVQRIRDAGGLIYFDSPLSEASDWAFFERQYALLLKKPIFRFDHQTGRITRWRSKPLDLAVFPSYSRHDQAILSGYLEMLRNRLFDCWSDESIMPGSSIQEEITEGIERSIQRGGYVLLFCTAASARSEWCRAELGHALTLYEHSNRVIPILVDGADPPTQVTDIKYFELSPGAGKSQAWLVDELVILLYRLVSRNIRKPDA